MLNRMLFKLYIVPCLLLISSFIAIWFFGTAVPNHFSQSAILVVIANTSYRIAPWVSLALCLASICWFISSTYKLWKWDNCKGDLCIQCGGISVMRSGRYGLYFQCLACRKNHAYLN